ncbi:MAG TPA: TRAP transporter substrate-binding protein [Syntrophorhabdaceae bacterium]|nr:TRAP transporter substrate-binding protein [Syntrophorhabdaceae bacterium]
MKKGLIILLAAVFLAVVGHISIAFAADTIELKLAEIHPKGYPTELGDEEFARLVKERTGGRINVTVYPGGQLGGDEKAVVEQVQMGAIDFARISLAPVLQFAKELNVLSLPYIYRDSNHMWKVLSGPIGQDLLKSVDKANLVGLAYYDAGARSFYNSKREIKSLADLKGLKIRVQEAKLMMDLVKALGASPTPMATGDVYSALQTNVIDGAENNWPSYISFSHYQVAKFYTVDGHTRVPEILIGSKKNFANLSKADLDIISKSAKDAVEFQKKKWAESEKVNEEKAKAAGCKITYLDAKTLGEFQKAVQPIYADYKEYADLIKKIQDVK